MKQLLNKIRHYYERELSAMQRFNAEFAAEFPAQAGMLGMQDGQRDDPHIERFIQATALSNARTAKLIDDNDHKLTEALLQVNYPHYVQPFPSTTIVRASARAGGDTMTACTLIARGATLVSRMADAPQCRFSTTYDVSITPLVLAKVAYASHFTLPPSLPRPPAVTTLLSIELRCDAAGIDLAQLRLDRLRVYIDAEPSLAATTRDVLFMRARAAYLETDGACVALQAVPLRPVGFAPGEALLPRHPLSQQAYLLLTEYFVYPEKFNFFDIDWTALAPLLPSGCRKATLHLGLADIPADSHLAATLTQLSADNFVIGCTPAVNLFKRAACPIELTHAAPDYELIADGSPAAAYDIYRVDRVTTVQKSARGQTLTEFRPYYSLRHGEAGGSAGRYVVRRDALTLAYLVSLKFVNDAEAGAGATLTNGEIMFRLIAIPGSLATAVVAMIAFGAAPDAAPATVVPAPASQHTPFMAQVVGLQWLNPLQRRDYSTEWQLLWTLGLVKPNQGDAKVAEKPAKYSKVQPISDIAYGNNGRETFKGYHHKYISELITPFRDIYFTDSSYFYNAHSLTDKSTWRELAGIHVEYALPEGKLDPVDAAKITREEIIGAFDIGNKFFPKAWSRATPPDVRLTMGGANAGFTSLAAGLNYLQTHPAETVWVMNWDAPSRPLDAQINENMVLLFLAGPGYKTGRAPLAWLGQPASARVEDFERKADMPPRSVQAWRTVFDKAAAQAQSQVIDIGFIIHDANNVHADSSDRLAGLARTATETIPEFDFVKQTFNTPALLGEIGAGTALTNVALGIAYANHFGKHVLVAGTSDPANPTATMIRPPAVVRPIDPSKPWFRARSIIHAHLPWWGIRYDTKDDIQGYSQK